MIKRDCMKGKDFLADALSLVEQYQNSIRADFQAIPDDSIWKCPVPGQVSPANQVLHLTGNLRHFMGHLVGGSDYKRDRDREFKTEPSATKAEILAGWETACEETREVLQDLDDDQLLKEAPVERFPGGVPVHRYILRLLGHLTYHAGQIRSLYRILQNDN